VTYPGTLAQSKQPVDRVGDLQFAITLTFHVQRRRDYCHNCVCLLHVWEVVFNVTPIT